jgi:hypothetical protein
MSMPVTGRHREITGINRTGGEGGCGEKAAIEECAEKFQQEDVR